MKDRLRIATRPSAIIAGLFQVSRVAKSRRFRGEIGFTLHIAAHNKRYIAIVGETGVHVCPRDPVYVRGCLLRRGDTPVLVASSLERIAGCEKSSQSQQLVCKKIAGGKSR